MSDVEDLASGGLFEEPKDFYKPEEQPGSDTYARQEKHVANSAYKTPTDFNLRLTAKNPLWGHLLWNAGKVTADYLDEHSRELVEGKKVIEFGAGAGLPSLLCHAVGAKQVVITDYPDADLLYNLKDNVEQLKKDCKAPGPCSDVSSMKVEGFIWGNDASELIEMSGGTGYDLVILSDVVFNHSEHAKLVRSAKELLAPGGKVFVVFTPHRAKLFNEDLDFFRRAKDEAGFHSEKLFELKYYPMFEEEEETKELRSMVFGYMLTLDQ
ncbi:Protein N-methyltransferase NNT1 [Yarrowia sp. B02]|nr:Protein N-methyltransferase NNT1 [Yarrowia sp. B02]